MSVPEPGAEEVIGVAGDARERVVSVVFTQEEIEERVAELGRSLSERYRDSRSLLVLGLLKGSFIFLADLVRTIQVPLQVDFLILSSYGRGRASTGEVRFLYDPDVHIRNRDVLVVEDIVDSGATIDRLLPILEERRPNSIEVCALLHKRVAMLKHEPHWVGFDAPPEFLVGYGLDHAEDFRHLPFIGRL